MNIKILRLLKRFSIHSKDTGSLAASAWIPAEDIADLLFYMDKQDVKNTVRPYIQVRIYGDNVRKLFEPIMEELPEIDHRKFDYNRLMQEEREMAG